jgi:hypothetical protein
MKRTWPGNRRRAHGKAMDVNLECGIRALALDSGADLFGIADLAPARGFQGSERT